MQDNNYNGNYNNNYNGNYNNNISGYNNNSNGNYNNNYNDNYNNDIGSYNNTGNNNDFDNGFNNQENNPNQLSSKKALKGYLVIFIIAGVLLSIYFLSDSKDSKKEDVKESNSNIVSETATHEEESNIVSNQNAAPVSNQNTTPVSNAVNNKTSNKSLAKSIPVKSISISGAKTVVAGSKITLKATINPSNASNKKVTWKSSNTNVATVSNSGVVTGVKAVVLL